MDLTTYPKIGISWRDFETSYPKIAPSCQTQFALPYFPCQFWRMAKTPPFQIFMAAGRAVLKIIGEISWWKNNSEVFTMKVDRLINEGIQDVDGYINSPGGDMFEANEIGNQIQRFEGEKLCTLGAVCASSGTLVSTYFDEITASENTQYMIHDPRQLALIQHEEDFDSQRELYVNLREDAVSRYSRKTGIKEDEIREMMRKTTWMNATTAKKKKFVDGIKDETGEMPGDTKNVFKTYAYDNIPTVFNIAFELQEHMKLSKITQRFGLKDDATEDEILAAIDAAQASQDPPKDPPAPPQPAPAGGEDKAVTLLVKWGESKGFKAATIKALAESNFNAAVDLINEADEPGGTGEGAAGESADALRMSQVLEKVLKETGSKNPAPDTAMTIEEMSKKAPEKLEALANNEPAKFVEMFEAEYGFKPNMDDLNALI